MSRTTYRDSARSVWTSNDPRLSCEGEVVALTPRALEVLFLEKANEQRNDGVICVKVQAFYNNRRSDWTYAFKGFV